MRPPSIPSLLAVCCLAACLAGCSAGGTLLESLPENMGGLPADTPATPKVPYKYPAVHDMPPPRADEPLTEKQQWDLEKTLTALRNRQESHTGGEEAPAKPAKTKAVKKKSKKKTAPQEAERTGAKTNP